MRRFLLARDFLDSRDELPITADEHTSAAEAFATISEIVLLEERFDALTSNFLDFEKSMMANLLEFNHVGIQEGMHQMNVRRQLNRFLTNTMSSAKGYVDHLPRTCNRVFGDTVHGGEEFKNLLRISYDSVLGYRIFEALRNHSQHFGFPIQSIEYGLSMDGEFPKMQARHTISPLIDVDALKRDSSFKASTLKEMEELGKKIDLKPHLRDYVTELSKTHYYFRELSSPVAEKSANLLNELANKYLAVFPKLKSSIGLFAFAVDEKTWLNRVPLFTGLDEYGRYLANNNVHFNHSNAGFLATADRNLQESKN